MFIRVVVFALRSFLWLVRRKGAVQSSAVARPTSCAARGPDSQFTNRRQSPAPAVYSPAGKPERRPAATRAAIPPIWCGGRTLYANGKMASSVREATIDLLVGICIGLAILFGFGVTTMVLDAFFPRGEHAYR